MRGKDDCASEAVERFLRRFLVAAAREDRLANITADILENTEVRTGPMLFRLTDAEPLGFPQQGHRYR